MTSHTTATLGAALLNGQLVKIMCTDLRVGDWVQDESAGEMHPVLKVNKSSVVVDARAMCECETGEFAQYFAEDGHSSVCNNDPICPPDMMVRLPFRAGHYVMGIKAV